MNCEEHTSVFDCGNDRLIAIVSRSSAPATRGVIVVVGGPQYRAGSHRQFTLLSRALAAQGIASMRFDCRGMGDSGGAMRNFEDLQPDIHAAIDHFFDEMAELREVVIWGLCDAASAALMTAHRDKRITGLVLLNPWVRTPEGLAKAQLKHYYWSRLTDREFWSKIGRGDFTFATSLRSFASAVKMALGLRRVRAASADAADKFAPVDADQSVPLPERMADGMSRFSGKVLLILSGNDLTAQEFDEVVRESSRWRRLLADARVERRMLPDANHTFARAEWRDQVATWTAEWVRSW